MSLRHAAVLLYLLAIVPIGFGFHKLFVYQNYDPSEFPSLSKTNVNAYVGGDAYNFIINAGQATAYFTLAVFIGLIASTLLIISYLKEKEIVPQDEGMESDREIEEAAS